MFIEHQICGLGHKHFDFAEKKTKMVLCLIYIYLQKGKCGKYNMSKKKILFIFIALILVVLALACIEEEQPPAPPTERLPLTPTPQPVPIEENPFMLFGAQLTFASGNMEIDLAELKEQLKVIEETGVDVVRLDLSYDAWMINDKANIERHDKIIQQIRDDSKLLMIADKGADSFIGHPVTWEEFKKQHLKHTRIFMERYRPDYYVVVKEPVWYRDFEKMISTETTPEMWRGLAKEACSIVKEISPNTKTAIAIYPSGEQEEEFFKKVADIDNLDIMGVDCYDDKDLGMTANKLLPYVPPDKKIWMLESWNGGGSSYLQPWKKEADAEWINKSVRYSQEQNFGGYIVYYPLHFSSYMKYKNVNWTQRTSAFYAFKEVVEETR